MSMKALGLNAQDEGAHFYKSPDVNENFGQGNVDTAIEALAFSERYLKNIMYIYIMQQEMQYGMM